MIEVVRKHYSAGIWLAVIAAFGYSFKAILVKLAYSVPQPTSIDAITLLTLRMLFALPFFLWFSRSSRSGAKPFGLRDGFLIIGFGLVGYYAASVLDFVGLQYISTGLERVILFAYPILTLFYERLCFKKTIQRYEWTAVFICYSGIALVFMHDLGQFSGQKDVLLGSVLVLLSAACYALYLAGGSGLIARHGSVRFASSALVVASVASGVHFASLHTLSALRQPLEIYALAFTMALLCTVIPAFALAASIRRIGSSKAALIGSLGPVLTIALGWWLLDEPMSAQQLGGAALVIGAILVINKRGRNATSSRNIIAPLSRSQQKG